MNGTLRTCWACNFKTELWHPVLLQDMTAVMSLSSHGRTSSNNKVSLPLHSVEHALPPPSLVFEKYVHSSCGHLIRLHSCPHNLSNCMSVAFHSQTTWWLLSIYFNVSAICLAVLTNTSSIWDCEGICCRPELTPGDDISSADLDSLKLDKRTQWHSTAAHARTSYFLNESCAINACTASETFLYHVQSKLDVLVDILRVVGLLRSHPTRKRRGESWSKTHQITKWR